MNFHEFKVGGAMGRDAAGHSSSMKHFCSDVNRQPHSRQEGRFQDSERSSLTLRAMPMRLAQWLGAQIARLRATRGRLACPRKPLMAGNLQHAGLQDVQISKAARQRRWQPLAILGNIAKSAARTANWY